MTITETGVYNYKFIGWTEDGKTRIAQFSSHVDLDLEPNNAWLLSQMGDMEYAFHSTGVTKYYRIIGDLKEIVL